jgi:antitoxin component of RelBE/YafQ-DinJ toxin-antitoxin module
MNTQVIFNLDKKLKEKAMKKSRSEGVAFSSVLKLATKAFVEGDLDVRMIPKKELNEKTKKIIEKALKNIKEGKNLSPSFDNAKDAIAYLKAL